MWNSLFNDVVSVKTVNCFESKLDEFWQYQDVKCDFGAEINQKPE